MSLSNSSVSPCHCNNIPVCQSKPPHRLQPDYDASNRSKHRPKHQSKHRSDHRPGHMTSPVSVVIYNSQTPSTCQVMSNSDPVFNAELESTKTELELLQNLHYAYLQDHAVEKQVYETQQEAYQTQKAAYEILELKFLEQARELVEVTGVKVCQKELIVSLKSERESLLKRIQNLTKSNNPNALANAVQEISSLKASIEELQDINQEYRAELSKNSHNDNLPSVPNCQLQKALCELVVAHESLKDRVTELANHNIRLMSEKDQLVRTIDDLGAKKTSSFYVSPEEQEFILRHRTRIANSEKAIQNHENAEKNHAAKLGQLVDLIREVENASKQVASSKQEMDHTQKFLITQGDKDEADEAAKQAEEEAKKKAERAVLDAALDEYDC